jgi:hypothetical protein
LTWSGVCTNKCGYEWGGIHTCVAA